MTGMDVAKLMKPETARVIVADLDMFDPRGIILISYATAHGGTDLAKLRAAHECAHAIQWVQGRAAFVFWRVMSPLVWPLLGVSLALAGLISRTHTIPALSFCAVVAVLRYYATMWLEKDAWEIAFEWLKAYGVLDDEKKARQDAEAMLNSYRAR